MTDTTPPPTPTTTSLTWKPTPPNIWTAKHGQYECQISVTGDPGWLFTTYASAKGSGGHDLFMVGLHSLEEAQEACERAFQVYRASVRREAEALGFEVAEKAVEEHPFAQSAGAFADDPHFQKMAGEILTDRS